MKKELKEIQIETEKDEEIVIERTVRNRKYARVRIDTQLSINNSIQGDSIEIMMERIREGEGEDAIQDRDLVYNDAESNTVNPVTNIRTDKFESMLDEKIGEYEHKNKKIQRTEEAEKEKIKQKEEEKQKSTGTEGTETVE
ncbi:MAG: hypothetical protein [Wigfec virus K19_83]|nr:MAG: hypothetical protein [Wigfec virus K19_83]